MNCRRTITSGTDYPTLKSCLPLHFVCEMTIIIHQLRPGMVINPLPIRLESLRLCRHARMPRSCLSPVTARLCSLRHIFYRTLSIFRVSQVGRFVPLRQSHPYLCQQQQRNCLGQRRLSKGKQHTVWVLSALRRHLWLLFIVESHVGPFFGYRG